MGSTNGNSIQIKDNFRIHWGVVDMAINPNNVLHLVVGDVASNDLMGSTFKNVIMVVKGIVSCRDRKNGHALKHITLKLQVYGNLSATLFWPLAKNWTDQR